ncbi:MAG: ATP-dependent metallopeptidase FtsH/Yme1/Tma family protein, partial [Pyrinomonadaceae bacterium]
MSSKAKQLLLWALIIGSAISVVWFIQNKQVKSPQELSIDMAATRIENKEFKKAEFKQSQVEFTDNDGNKFVTTYGSDATHALLGKKVDDFNTQNPTVKITTNEESASSGIGWLI